MGGWKLEAFKMFIYMGFPVGTFYIFHQPQYFEKWVLNVKSELFPPENVELARDLKSLAKKMRDVEDGKLLEQLEAAQHR